MYVLLSPFILYMYPLGHIIYVSTWTSQMNQKSYKDIVNEDPVGSDPKPFSFLLLCLRNPVASVAAAGPAALVNS